MHGIRKLAALPKLAGAIMAFSLAACASGGGTYTKVPVLAGRSVAGAAIGKPLQCAPYAREHSKVKIFGDAYTWWDQADGKYPRGSAPVPGAVMVLYDYAGPQKGHLAVVRNTISKREIRVDHANWLNDGSIYVNNPVLDVSENNDWSKVRVFNIQTGGWGAKIYPVRGFIGSRKDVDDKLDESRPDLVASAAFGQAAPELR